MIARPSAAELAQAWPAQRSLCPGCRRTLGEDEACECEEPPSPVSLEDIARGGGGACAGLEPTTLARQSVTRESLFTLLAGIGVVGLPQAGLVFLRGEWIFGGVIAGLSTFGIAVAARRRWRWRRLPAARFEPASTGRLGTVRALQSAPAPLSADGCVAWSAELRYEEGFVYQCPVLRCAVSGGFRIELEGGEPPIRVPPGRVELVGKGTRHGLSACMNLLDWLFPGRAWSPNELGIRAAYQVVLRDGDRVRVHADLSREADPAGGGGDYRQSADMLAHPLGIPRIALLESAPR